MDRYDSDIVLVIYILKTKKLISQKSQTTLLRASAKFRDGLSSLSCHELPM